jgi:hypothetical protein
MPVSTDWRTIQDDKEKYQAYLCSPEWGRLRAAVHERAEGVCERCKILPIDAVHHLTYARKYDEPLEDLQEICEPCHQFTHGKATFDPASSVSLRLLHMDMGGWFVEEPYRPMPCELIFKDERIATRSIFTKLVMLRAIRQEWKTWIRFTGANDPKRCTGTVIDLEADVQVSLGFSVFSDDEISELKSETPSDYRAACHVLGLNPDLLANEKGGD